MLPKNSFETLPPLRRRVALIGLVAPLAFVVACGSGGSDAKVAPTTAAPTTTAATTTTTEVDGDAAGEEFQGLIEDADDAITKEASDRDDMAADNDLDSAIDSAGELKDELEGFQADLADLEVPKDAQEPIDQVDEATSDYVDVLAGYADVEDIPGYNDQFDQERDAYDAWHEAIAEAADALDVDGLPDSSSDDSGSDDSGSDDSGSDGSHASSPISGAGSKYCLVSEDLPDGFLPLKGQDNTSNALSYTFDEGPEAAYADALVSSWMVLPDGGAGPDDLTADCIIHIFTSPEKASAFYDVWTADYGADSMPEPEEVDVPDGAPGDDPHSYLTEVGGRPTGDQIFLYENVVVSVGLDGTSSNDPQTITDATNDLANIVFGRLESGS
jgi:hypothetical protein